jgi:hypothetical protein
MLNFPFHKAVTQKNTDGTHSVIIHHNNAGVVTEVSFSLVAHAEAIAKNVADYLNSHVVVGPNRTSSLPVRTDGETVIVLKKPAAPKVEEKAATKVQTITPIDVSAKAGSPDKLIDTSVKVNPTNQTINVGATSVFSEPSKNEQAALQAEPLPAPAAVVAEKVEAAEQQHVHAPLSHPAPTPEINTIDEELARE